MAKTSPSSAAMATGRRPTWPTRSSSRSTSRRSARRRSGEGSPSPDGLLRIQPRPRSARRTGDQAHVRAGLPHRLHQKDLGLALQGAREPGLSLAQTATADRGHGRHPLISGGGSSLLVAPARGLTLADKQASTGPCSPAARRSEMNCVRRHLSAIKGGRLAAGCHPAPLVTLLIFDVPGDDPIAIASGPTVGDPPSPAPRHWRSSSVAASPSLPLSVTCSEAARARPSSRTTSACPASRRT